LYFRHLRRADLDLRGFKDPAEEMPTPSSEDTPLWTALWQGNEAAPGNQADSSSDRGHFLPLGKTLEAKEY
jgi:hypothetical protein